jgi:CO/xanthine dehydrogenase FAD-binding subunit
MLHLFSYVSARSKEEVLSLLASLPEAALIAGGTDMVVRMRRGETHSHLIDVAGVPEIAGIEAQDGRLRIGAGATHARIAADAAVRKVCVALAIACSQVGSPQIRHMGTLGGNLANASPAADSLAPLLVHNAEATLESAGAVRRETTIEALITAPYKTTLGENELISSISMDALEGYEEGYRRVAKRAAWAISRLSCAWAIREEDGVIADARIAVGSCTPVPFRPHQAEDFLKGRRREASVVAQAVGIVLDEIRRLAGMRPSFVYKLPTVRDLLTSALGGLSCS